MTAIRVRSGDSPMGLAARLTGDPSRWRELVAANPHKPRQLVRGDETFQALAAGETLIAPGSWLVKQFGRVSVSAAQVAAHVMRPQALAGVRSDAGALALAGVRKSSSTGLPVVTLPKGIFNLPLVPAGKTAAFRPELFESKMRAFGSQTVGFALELRQLGTPLLALQNGYSLRTSQAWSLDTPQHIASVSKLWTAACMVRLLRERFPGQNAIDRPILPFLPSYWVTGPNIERITFRLLLQHQTGLGSSYSGSGDADFETTKSEIAAGAPSWPNGYSYKNVNYSLCRILLAVLQGNMDVNWTDASGDWVNTDKTWDLVSIKSLEGYVQDTLLAQAGAAEATLTRRSGSAYAYQFPPDSSWDSGDVSTWAGAAGWHMSVREMLNVLAYARRGGFLPTGAFDSQVLSPQLGIDVVWVSPIGPAWTKGGLFQSSSGQIEQSAIFILPQGMELAVLVNSPVGVGNFPLQQTVFDNFMASIT